MTESETSLVLRLVGLTSGLPTDIDGQWVVEYDPTRRGVNGDGRSTIAHLICTDDPKKARRFPTFEQAHSYWVAPSGRRPPVDKPLTAYNALIEPAPQED